MTEKVLTPGTISLISGASLTAELTWTVGPNTLSSVDHANYIASFISVSGAILTAIANDPDFIPDPDDRENKRTFNWSAARNGTNQPNQALRRQNGTVTTNVPYIIPFDCTLYAATAENSPGDVGADWDMQVENNSSVVYTLNVPNSDHKAVDNNASVQFSEGDEVTMWMRNQTQTVDYPGCTLYFMEV